jgi:hypothetical protein
MNGFNNLPCLDVSISSEGLNGTVELGKYGDFTIQSNNRECGFDSRVSSSRVSSR